MASTKLAALILYLTSGLLAQDPVYWTVASATRAFRAGETFHLDVTAAIDSTWHIYSVTQRPGGPFPTRFSVPEDGTFRLVGLVTGPSPVVEMDANFGIKTESLAGSPAFRVPVLVVADAPGEKQFHINVR